MTSYLEEKEMIHFDGGEGNDTLDGGEGADKMRGGLGSDTFVCDQFDSILDFNSGEHDTTMGMCSAKDQAKPSTVKNPSTSHPSPTSPFPIE